MKTTARTAFLGAMLGGAIAQLAVLACGKVSATPDASAASDTQTSADGPATTTAAFAGFSYHTNGAVKAASWSAVVIDVLDYNTFTSASYDVSTGTFTAPAAGYYRFSTYGFSPSATASPDTRIAAGFALNGTTPDHIVAIAGGQLSTGNSPMPSLSHVLHLNAGDKISVMVFSDAQITLGRDTAPIDAYYFQGELLGQ